MSAVTATQRRLGVLAHLQRGALLILIAAFFSFLLSVALWFAGDRQYGIFVGLWVPSILAAGGFWMVANGTRP